MVLVFRQQSVVGLVSDGDGGGGVGVGESEIHTGHEGVDLLIQFLQELLHLHTGGHHQIIALLGDVVGTVPADVLRQIPQVGLSAIGVLDVGISSGLQIVTVSAVHFQLRHGQNRGDAVTQSYLAAHAVILGGNGLRHSVLPLPYRHLGDSVGLGDGAGDGIPAADHVRDGLVPLGLVLTPVLNGEAVDLGVDMLVGHGGDEVPHGGGDPAHKILLNGKRLVDGHGLGGHLDFLLSFKI